MDQGQVDKQAGPTFELERSHADSGLLVQLQDMSPGWSQGIDISLQTFYQMDFVVTVTAKSPPL